MICSLFKTSLIVGIVLALNLGLIRGYEFEEDEDYFAGESRSLGGKGGGGKDGDGGGGTGMQNKLEFQMGDVSVNIKAILCCIAILCIIKAAIFFLGGGNMDDLLSGFTSTGTGYGAPSSSYDAPSSSYDAPSNEYGAPSSSYNAPAQQSYSAPSTGYSAGNQISTQQGYNNYVAREDVLSYAMNDLVGGNDQYGSGYQDVQHNQYYHNEPSVQSYQLLKKRK